MWHSDLTNHQSEHHIVSPLNKHVISWIMTIGPHTTCTSGIPTKLAITRWPQLLQYRQLFKIYVCLQYTVLCDNVIEIGQTRQNHNNLVPVLTHTASLSKALFFLLSQTTKIILIVNVWQQKYCDFRRSESCSSLRFHQQAEALQFWLFSLLLKYFFLKIMSEGGVFTLPLLYAAFQLF